MGSRPSLIHSGIISSCETQLDFGGRAPEEGSRKTTSQSLTRNTAQWNQVYQDAEFLLKLDDAFGINDHLANISEQRKVFGFAQLQTFDLLLTKIQDVSTCLLLRNLNSITSILTALCIATLLIFLSHLYTVCRSSPASMESSAKSNFGPPVVTNIIDWLSFTHLL